MDCRVCNTEINKIGHKQYKCPNCLHTYIDYKEDGLTYHKELYRKGREGTRGGGEVRDGKFTKEFHARRQPIVNKRIKSMHEYAPDYISVLDIGAGGGTFVNALKYRTANIEVQEVSDLCANNLRDNSFKVHHGNFSEINYNKKYDLVTCWHVLEHIQDLQAFKTKLVEISKKYVVIEVPVSRNLRNPDKDWDGHFHYFSGRSMRELFEDEFETIYIGTEKAIQKPALLYIAKKKVVE